MCKPTTCHTTKQGFFYPKDPEGIARKNEEEKIQALTVWQTQTTGVGVHCTKVKRTGKASRKDDGTFHALKKKQKKNLWRHKHWPVSPEENKALNIARNSLIDMKLQTGSTLDFVIWHPCPCSLLRYLMKSKAFVYTARERKELRTRTIRKENRRNRNYKAFMAQTLQHPEIAKTSLRIPQFLHWLFCPRGQVRWLKREEFEVFLKVVFSFSFFLWLWMNSMTNRLSRSQVRTHGINFTLHYFCRIRSLN